MATLDELKNSKEMRDNILTIYVNFYWIHKWIIEVCSVFLVKEKNVERQLELVEQMWDERAQMKEFKSCAIELGYDWDEIPHDSLLFESMRERYNRFKTTGSYFDVVIGMNIFSEGIFGITELEELYKKSPEIFPRFPGFIKEEEEHAQIGLSKLEEAIENDQQLIPEIKGVVNTYRETLMRTAEDEQFSNFLKTLMSLDLLPTNIVDIAVKKYDEKLGYIYSL